MYNIITTPGFIIGSRPYGEAGKMLSIFTRDLGLVLAAAQGIRLEKSKLRYHTKEYSFGVFSLVRGKEFWRLTNAAEYDTVVIPAQAGIQDQTEAGGNTLDPRLHGDDTKTNFSPSRPHLRGEASINIRIATLLKRLLHGEDPNPELFECLQSAIDTTGNISKEKLPELESLVALRILNLLGYIGDSEVIRPFVSSNTISEEILADMSPLRPKVNGIINASLQASHL